VNARTEEITPNGNTQEFVIPQGATRLYLGVMDQTRWKDNVGGFAVDVQRVGRPSDGYCKDADRPMPPPVDLLASASPLRDTVSGLASRDVDALVLGGGTVADSMIQLPFCAPSYGDVELTVERLGGSGSFGVGLAAGQARFIATLDRPTANGPAAVILHQGPNGPLSTNSTYDQRLPLGKPVHIVISVNINQIRVSCGGELATYCVCPHANLLSHSSLESSYPPAIFLVARGAEFRITQIALAPREAVVEPITFSDAEREPERAAAELAIWKGACIQVIAAGELSRKIDHIRDIPARMQLVAVDTRDGRQGTTLDDRDLAVLKRTRRLERLDLSHSRITDAGLGTLYELQHLKQLRLNGTSVSPEGLDTLRQRLPGTEIRRDERKRPPELTGQPWDLPDRAPSTTVVNATKKPSPKLRFAATGNYYQRIDTPMTWQEAIRHCEGLGGYLATVTSAEENDFIYKNFAVDHACWLGATDEAEEGRWQWITGEPFEFQNWRSGEPGNSGSGEHYLVIGNSPDVIDGQMRYFYRFGPTWNDHAGHGKYRNQPIVYPVCEWDGQLVPTDNTTEDD
jgi:hypothetical protein